MRKVQFVEEEYYHIYNRGVDKRKTFMDDEDRYRFLHDLYEFNDENLTPEFCRRVNTVGNPVPHSEMPRELLVEISCFCLMPNHFHLILKQLVENGIPKFMQKMGGYTSYFNLKHERSGTLFQGPFKAVRIKTDDQMVHLNRYIHLNPVDIFQPKWKERGIKDLEETIKLLEKYRWSSYLDYIGIKNYPSLINKQFVLESYFKRGKCYKKFILDGLIEGNLSKIEQVILED